MPLHSKMRRDSKCDCLLEFGLLLRGNDQQFKNLSIQNEIEFYVLVGFHEISIWHNKAKTTHV